ncbi:uncharacterized [Tachysurus ichikawai]
MGTDSAVAAQSSLPSNQAEVEESFSPVEKLRHFTLPCILTIFREQRVVSDAESRGVIRTGVMSTLPFLMEKSSILATREKHTRCFQHMAVRIPQTDSPD